MAYIFVILLDTVTSSRLGGRHLELSLSVSNIPMSSMSSSVTINPTRHRTWNHNCWTYKVIIPHIYGIVVTSSKVLYSGEKHGADIRYV